MCDRVLTTGRPSQCKHPCCAFIVLRIVRNIPRQTKVSHFSIEIGIEQHITGCQIAMNQMVFNQVLHATGDVQCNVYVVLLFPTCESTFTHFPFFELRLQTAILAETDDQEKRRASCDNANHRNQVSMGPNLKCSGKVKKGTGLVTQEKGKIMQACAQPMYK